MFLYSARFKVCHPYIEDDISVVGNEETILVSDISKMPTLSFTISFRELDLSFKELKLRCATMGLFEFFYELLLG